MEAPLRRGAYLVSGIVLVASILSGVCPTAQKLRAVVAANGRAKRTGVEHSSSSRRWPVDAALCTVSQYRCGVAITLVSDRSLQTYQVLIDYSEDRNTGRKKEGRALVPESHAKGTRTREYQSVKYTDRNS